MEKRQRKYAPRSRFERDGLTIEDVDEWQTWEGTVYVYADKRSRYTRAMFSVPVDIMRYLNLKHKDRVRLAIKRAEEEAGR